MDELSRCCSTKVKLRRIGPKAHCFMVLGPGLPSRVGPLPDHSSMLLGALCRENVDNSDRTKTLRAGQTEHGRLGLANTKHGCVSLFSGKLALKKQAKACQVNAHRLNCLSGVAAGMLDGVCIDLEAMHCEQLGIPVLPGQHLTEGMPTGWRRLHVLMDRPIEHWEECAASGADV